MIQRIQTFFLFDVVVLGIIILFMPLFHFQQAMVLPNGATGSGVDGKDVVLFAVMLGIVMLMAIAAIFMFKNRKRQMRMCMGGVLVSLLFALQAVFFPFVYIHSEVKIAIGPAVGAYLLFIIPVLFFLAYYFVNKDEKLVRSADRLR